ncbi:MAG: sulfurtransferase-like selenium metabolism protein YedF [Actinobacteria bacterium]|jgi:selenium metabolism protein YedF|nr:MAG: sulfurtransferase-like selenium metabolism protein YedF [Actinomycetota bacterium]
MGELVDARGLACPAPVVRTRDALKSGAVEIEVLVDNPTARDNVCRFASSQGCKVDVAEEGDIFRIMLSGPGDQPDAGQDTAGAATDQRIVVVLSEDIMGRGSAELGKILVKAFLNTLAENDPPPWRMVLFNRGVLLSVEGEDTVEALRNLHGMGVEILVCGTCLDFFGCKDKVAVGTVSNMYDILTTMLAATNSVTI